MLFLYSSTFYSHYYSYTTHILIHSVHLNRPHRSMVLPYPRLHTTRPYSPIPSRVHNVHHRQKSGLPEWTQEGAIVGLEGGTGNVSRIVSSLVDARVPIADDCILVFVVFGGVFCVFCLRYKL